MPERYQEVKGFRIYLIGPFGRIVHVASWHRIQDAAESDRASTWPLSASIGSGSAWLLSPTGLLWVWNALEECFPEGRCILDYYHCAEHVWGAADALHGEGTSEAREWAEAFLTELCLGKVGKSIAALTLTENQTALQTEALENPATYLEHQTRRIHYIDDIDGGVSETVTNGLIGIYSCVLVGISYHLHTFSIPRAFSGGIRPRNAVWSQLGVKLTQYSRQIYMTTTRGDP